MDYQNFTQFPTLAYEGLDQYDQEFHVVALRMTYDIRSDNLLEFAEKQNKLVEADEYFGVINKSSVMQESDLVHYKPKCDVIVIGSAYAPGGKPASRFEVGIKISGSSSLLKRLVVTGPRSWNRGLLGWSLTKPKPIFSLPLQYEYAYGGECRVDIDDPTAKRIKEKFQLTPEQRQNHPDGVELAPVAHTAFGKNPVGRGYIDKWYDKAVGRKINILPAPQIETKSDPIKKFGKPYTPQGFGVVAKGWQPRLKLAGTYDTKFMQSEQWLPDDFDFGFWNCAPDDMQIPYPDGRETITLLNLMPPGEQNDDTSSLTQFVLPGHRPFLLARLTKGQMVPVDLNIDTLIINTDEKTVSLVYRAVLPKDPEVRVLEARMMNKEETEEYDLLVGQLEKEVQSGRDSVGRRSYG